MWEILLTLMSMTVICLLFYLKLWWQFRYWLNRGILHDRPKIPSGNMHEWLHTKHMADIFGETYNKYKGTGPYAGFFFNTHKAVVILDIDLAKRILENDFQYFQNRGFFNNVMDDPLTGNLYLLDGPEWRALKTKISSIFDVNKVKEIYDSLMEVGVELERSLAAIVAASPGGIIEANNIASRFVIDVISNSVYGVNCHSLIDPATPFFANARTFFTKRRHAPFIDSLINCYPGWAKSLHMALIPQEVTDYFMGLVEHIVKYRAERAIRKPDFLGLLMRLRSQRHSRGNERITVEELSAQCFSFFITAFDTCAATISYLLLEIAANSHIQDNLRSHIVQKLRRHNNSFSYDCLHDMQYLDRIIMETMRKHPVVPAMFRKCTKRYVPPNYPGFYIDKDCTVIIPALSYHHDPEYFLEPERFLPERFNNTNIRSIREGSYLPFGAGPRACIGKHVGFMIIKIAVVKLIHRYKFNICSQTRYPVEVALRSFNLQPTDIPLKVTRI